jgi:flagellar biosynthetic protein FliP
MSRRQSLFFLILAFFVFFPENIFAVTFPIPSIELGVKTAETPQEVAVALEVIALLTILTLAPAILILMTSFTRIIVVFHFLRQGMGIQTSPPNQVIVGLTIFMTFFIMKPVWNDVYENALDPYLNNKIDYQQAYYNAEKPIKKFMLANTREKDLALFVSSATGVKPKTKEDVNILHLIPAFVISELKTAFIIGFMIYIPFIVLDMVVASVLLSMGMMMLPPIMISLPFKLMLFVLVDGWNLLIGSMIKSFVVP